MTRTCQATGEAVLVPGSHVWSKVSRITGITGKSTEDETVAAGSVVALKRGNARGAKGPCCTQLLRSTKRGRGEPIDSSVNLQELRRRVYVKAKAFGPITLDAKCAGARSAGNPHVACEEAGAGNGDMIRTEAPAFGESRRQQLLPLPESTAPALDPTRSSPAPGSRRERFSGSPSSPSRAATSRKFAFPVRSLRSARPRYSSAPLSSRRSSRPRARHELTSSKRCAPSELVARAQAIVRRSTTRPQIARDAGLLVEAPHAILRGLSKGSVPPRSRLLLNGLLTR